jgi:hypothetical protein
MKCQSEADECEPARFWFRAGPHIPRPVPAGLIHDWIGVAFFPNTKLNDVLAVVGVGRTR